MRSLWLVLGLVLSMASAHAQKLVASGKPLLLHQFYSTNPDCSSAGSVEVRVTQPPEHGRVTVRRTGVFPVFPESNIRSVCNRRRVAGVQVIYVSQRGYVGPDFTELQALSPAGRGLSVRLSIRVL